MGDNINQIFIKFNPNLFVQHVTSQGGHFFTEIKLNAFGLLTRDLFENGHCPKRFESGDCPKRIKSDVLNV